jgi:hypothetical protein
MAAGGRSMSTDSVRLDLYTRVLGHLAELTGDDHEVGYRFWKNWRWNMDTSESYRQKYWQTVTALNLSGSQPAEEIGAYLAEDEIYCGLLNFRRLDEQRAAERAAAGTTISTETING